MGLGDVISKLLYGFAAAPGTADASTALESHPAAANMRRPQEHEASPEVLSGTSEVLAGTISLVGLSAIRERLGLKWADVSSRAFVIAQEEIEKALSPGDIFRHHGDEGFLICFEDSDQGAANRQAGRIAAAIEARLQSEVAELEKDAEVATFVASVDSSALTGHEDPFVGLFASLSRIQTEASITSHPVLPALRNARALFQPMWSTDASDQTINRCLLDASSCTVATKIFEGLRDPGELTQAIGDLDCVVFTRSVEALHQASKLNTEVRVLIPVHFSTVSDWDSRNNLLQLAATLPRHYRKLISLEIVGVPRLSDSQDLHRAASTAANMTDQVLMQIWPDDERLNAQLLQHLLWGVSVNLKEFEVTSAAGRGRLAELVTRAQELALHTMAYGANSLGKAQIAADAKLGHIAGTAVHPTLTSPRPAGRFMPLFGDGKRRATSAAAVAAVAGRTPRVERLEAQLSLRGGGTATCTILLASCSGASVISDLRPEPGTLVALGTIPGRVVRQNDGGFVVQFLQTQEIGKLHLALAAKYRDVPEISSEHSMEGIRIAGR